MSITVPIILVDAQGRRAEAQNVAIDATQIFIAVGPIGCFVFDKTDEKDPISGAYVFKQRVGPAPGPPEPDKAAIILQ